jgi:hypothetical protein
LIRIECGGNGQAEKSETCEGERAEQEVPHESRSLFLI